MHRSRLLHQRSHFPGKAKTFTVNEQRAAALHFTDPRVQTLYTFCCYSFSSRAYSPPRTYESILLHCWEKAQPTEPGTDHLRPAPAAPPRPHRAYSENHRYRITAKGLCAVTFYTGLHNRSLRAGLAIISPSAA